MRIADMSIYDYLVLNHMHLKTYHVYYKLAGAITGKQVAFAIGRGDHTDHISLMKHAIKKMNIPYDYKHEIIRFETSSVKVFAYEYFLGIHLPKKITYQQYKMIEDIVNQVRQFEKDYNIKIKTYPEFEEILEEAKEKIDDFVFLERDEKIVGTPINEQYLIDSINRELNIENCKDGKDLRKAARIISKYYHDIFFKDVIVKIVPNAEQIANLFVELFGFDRYFDKISINTDDFSYEGIEIYLQKLLSEIEKKREAELFDMMYNEALRDNEEFDRKKAEEVRQYSEMYEQAQRENEEFDRKKIEEEYQSLIESESQKHDEWERNMSSYDLYSKYKSSIEDRLEFEKARGEFENISQQQLSKISDDELDNSSRTK